MDYVPAKEDSLEAFRQRTQQRRERVHQEAVAERARQLGRGFVDRRLEQRMRNAQDNLAKFVGGDCLTRRA